MEGYMFTHTTQGFPQLMEDIAIEKTRRAAPGAPVRLLSENDGENAFAMKLSLSDSFTIPHSGYLTCQILNIQREFGKEGSPIHIFFVDEKRSKIRAFEELALNPSDGRLLFCAVGRGSAPRLALRKLALAERRWPRQMSLLDSDGFTKENRGKREDNQTAGRKEVLTSHLKSENASSH
jgi:hypothetical protein